MINRSETNFKEILPAGTVVTLNIMKDKYKQSKFLIIKRFVTEKAADKEYFEYEAMLLPMGTKDGKNMMFNHEHINEVIQKGYTDDKEIKILKILEDAIKKEKLVKRKVGQ